MTLSGLAVFATTALAETTAAEKTVAAQPAGDTVEAYFVNASGGA